jgi:hypothetical protein
MITADMVRAIPKERAFQSALQGNELILEACTVCARVEDFNHYKLKGLVMQAGGDMQRMMTVFTARGFTTTQRDTYAFILRW